MKLSVSLLLTFLVSSICSLSQSSDWQVNYTKQRIFVENKGQFDQDANESTGEVFYAAELPKLRILFGAKGISYQFKEIKFIPKEERNAILEQTVSNVYEYKQREKLHGKYLVSSDEINMTWDQVNENVEVIAEGLTEDYQSYSVNDSATGEVVGFDHCRQYTKITYLNFLDGIDIEYTIHPDSGIKYAIRVHPYADPSMVKMAYDVNASVINNEVLVPTLFGQMIDHQPVSYYANDHNNQIATSFVKNGNNIHFELGNYDQSKTIIIDPWVQNPNDPNSNWDCVWELDYDNSGNVYVIAGIMPLQLLKYNASGTLQWTHNTPYDTTAWLGTMATDDAGNSYVTNGTAYKIQKVNTGGGLVWNNNNPSGPGVQLSTEFWNISFNCDQTKLLIGGSGGGLNIHGRVYDVDMNSGNVNSSMMVTFPGGMFSIPIAIQEIRAMCAAPNGKYYFVSLDTIGYLSDDLTACAGGGSLLKDANGVGWGYKAENWRYNNTGIKAIRADANYVYTHRGDLLQQRSLVDFSIQNTVSIPNGTLQSVFLGGKQMHNAGIDIDNCGNIYVGSIDGVYKFDIGLSQVGFYSTPFKVWDCRVTALGDLIACGGSGTSSDNSRTGGVKLFGGVACTPVPLTCCNTNFCNPGPLCEQDPAVVLTPEVPGGTWSGTGVDATGTFDPSVAGIGNHLITYTLPCGSGSIIISVIACNDPLAVCEETNNTLTASGGDGTYSWYEGTSVANTINITNAATCSQCGGTAILTFGIFYNHCEDALGNTITSCTEYTFGWSGTPYATGSNTPPPSSYPILIIDGSGDSLIINDQSELTACVVIPLAVELKDYMISCHGDKALLEWTTISENNNAQFEIERAYGNGKFELIASVQGAKNSASERSYSYIDYDRGSGRAYYRLYEVDLDGNRNAIGTKSVDCTNSEVEMYPNPFTDEIVVNIGDLLVNADGILELMDSNGKIVYHYDIPKNASHFNIETSTLSRGVYTVKISGNNAVYIKKMVK